MVDLNRRLSKKKSLLLLLLMSIPDFLSFDPSYVSFSNFFILLVLYCDSSRISIMLFIR